MFGRFLFDLVNSSYNTVLAGPGGNASPARDVNQVRWAGAVRPELDEGGGEAGGSLIGF